VNVCTRCGSTLSGGVAFCSACRHPARDLTRAFAVSSAASNQAARAKGLGAFAGWIAGGAVAACLIVVGFLLCLTGVGMILGIPIILAGFVMPFIGPFLGARALKGACPYCRSVVLSASRGFNCPVCKRRIVVRGTRFMRIG
jgi:hypothetical protein